MHPIEIVTYTGRRVNPLDVKPEDIDIRDIAHSLALTNRFAGHSRVPVSVARHSILVADLVSREYQLQALLHDATEAYLGDMTKWLKRQMPAFIEAEDRLWKTIAEWADVPVELHPFVKRADNVAVMVEARHVLTAPLNLTGPDYEPLEPLEQRWSDDSIAWLPLDALWQKVEQAFLINYRENQR